MHRHRLLRFAIALFPLCAALASAATLSGCEKANGAPTGRLSTPPEGSARIVATKVAESSSKVHWKWSLIGERNWGGASVSEATEGGKPGRVLALTDPSAINDPKMRKASNVWELDLVAERGSGGKVEWKATLHSSDGTTKETSGSESISSEVAVGEIVRIQQTNDATLSLPASLTVAEIGGKPLVFRVAK